MVNTIDSALSAVLSGDLSKRVTPRQRMQSGATRLDSNISTGIALPWTNWISSFQHFSLLHAFEALILERSVCVRACACVSRRCTQSRAVKSPIYVYIYVCIYMYIYIHTHTHTHTYCIGRYETLAGIRGEEIISSLGRACESTTRETKRSHREPESLSRLCSSVRGNAYSRIDSSRPPAPFFSTRSFFFPAVPVLQTFLLGRCFEIFEAFSNHFRSF